MRVTLTLSLLLSWDLHLPLSKRDPVRSDGTVDEVLFRAHLMIVT